MSAEQKESYGTNGDLKNLRVHLNVDVQLRVNDQDSDGKVAILLNI